MTFSLAALTALATASAGQAWNPSPPPPSYNPRTASYSKPIGASGAPAAPRSLSLSKPAEVILPAVAPEGRSVNLSKSAGTSAAWQGPALPVPQTDPRIQRVAFQQVDPMYGGAGLGEDSQEYQIQLEPPGRSQLFQLDSELRLQERMRQEARQRPVPERITFPEEPIVSQQPFPGRFFPPINGIVEPSYLCYKPLLFYESNAERYGWDLGAIQPLVSAGHFFASVALLPYNLGKHPCHPYECSAGQCLPGDPVPFRVYPVGLSFTGVVTQAATAIVLLAVFP